MTADEQTTSTPEEAAAGEVRQSFPRIRIAKQPDPETGEHEVTITVKPGVPPPYVRETWRGLVEPGSGAPLPQPLFSVKPNEAGDGFEVYVTLRNLGDAVTVGRPQSQGVRGGGSG